MKWMKKEKIRLNFLQRFIFFYAVIGFLPLLNGLLYSGMAKINSTYFDDHLTLIRLGPMIFFYVTLPVFYLINQMDYKPNYFNPDVWDNRIKTFKLIMSVIVWVFIYRSMVVFFFGIRFWDFTGELSTVTYLLHGYYTSEIVHARAEFSLSDPSAMFGSMFAFTIIWPITLLVGMFTLVLMKNRSLRNENRRTA